MSYVAQTKFQYIQCMRTASGDPYTLQVPGEGAGSIQFLALPLRYVGPSDEFNPDYGFAWNRDQGVHKLQDVAVQVNGVPLLPAVLDLVQPYNMPGGSGPGRQFFNRLEAGERLEFKHGPAVHDQTVYQLTFPDPNGQMLAGVPDVMVIRTYYTPIR